MAVAYPEGMELVEESFSMSDRLGFSHDQIRAAVNIGWSAIYFRDLDTAERWVVTAHELALDREMPSFEAYAVVARGLVAYDATELPALLGRSTRELAAALGPEYEREVVHRDDMVLLR
jgi:hypothetical protein